MSLLLLKPGETYPVTDLIPVVGETMDAIFDEASGHALVLASLRPSAKRRLIKMDHPLAAKVNPIISLGGYAAIPSEKPGEQSPWAAPEICDSLQVVSQILGFENPETGRDVAKVLAELSVVHDDHHVTVQALSSLASRACAMGSFGPADRLFNAAQTRFISLRHDVAMSVCERYVYALTAQEDFRAARMQAGFAERLATENNVNGHPLGLIHLAYAHLYAVAGQTDLSVRSYKQALPLLDPALGFGACFQAIFNIADLLADHDEYSEAAELLNCLRSASPFLEDSLPMLLLEWAAGLLQAQQAEGDVEEAAKAIEGVRSRLPSAYFSYWLKASVHLANLYVRLDRQAAIKALGHELSEFLENSQEEVPPKDTWLASRFCYAVAGEARGKDLSFLPRKLGLQCHLA